MCISSPLGTKTPSLSQRWKGESFTKALYGIYVEYGLGPDSYNSSLSKMHCTRRSRLTFFPLSRCNWAVMWPYRGSELKTARLSSCLLPERTSSSYAVNDFMTLFAVFVICHMFFFSNINCEDLSNHWRGETWNSKRLHYFVHYSHYPHTVNKILKWGGKMQQIHD